MHIVIGSDCAAVDMKREIIDHLIALGHTVDDVSADEYPVAGFAAARRVAAGDADLGVIMCGTGVGISLAANKVKGIRAVVCSEPYTARLSREHNNANMLAFGARVIGVELAKTIVDAWLGAEFAGEGTRHAARVDMITKIEETGAL
ncbi:MAG: ribose 5-phosphate isomerase B [Clostridiales bacterium]|jgi:ribose 5-phosphate isomerase B|nr:ribose 5-phosphate isomerase B [Clostridiales bacterium]